MPEFHVLRSQLDTVEGPDEAANIHEFVANAPAGTYDETDFAIDFDNRRVWVLGGEAPTELEISNG